MIILSVNSLENRHLVSRVVGVFSTRQKALEYFHREYSIFEDQLFVPTMVEAELDKPELTQGVLPSLFEASEELFLRSVNEKAQANQ